MKRKQTEERRESVKLKTVILYSQGIIKKIYANGANKNDS